MAEPKMKYQVLIQEKRPTYGLPIVANTNTNPPTPPSPAFEYVSVIDAGLDDPVVLAGLLRSMADRLDPPKEGSRYY